MIDDEDDDGDNNLESDIHFDERGHNRKSP